MESGNDNIQSKVDKDGKGMVDNQKTDPQSVPSDAGRPVRGLNWTAILARAGLESPGYKETVEKMKADGRLKN